MFIMKVREVRKQADRENSLYRKCVPAESGNEPLPFSADRVYLKKVHHFVKNPFRECGWCVGLLHQHLFFKRQSESSDGSCDAAGISAGVLLRIQGENDL